MKRSLSLLLLIFIQELFTAKAFLTKLEKKPLMLKITKISQLMEVTPFNAGLGLGVLQHSFSFLQTSRRAVHFILHANRLQINLAI